VASPAEGRAAVRLLNSWFVVLGVVCLSTTCAFAQSVGERRVQEQIEPYHKHHDRLHGHNHVYPDRGALFREVPQGAVVVNYAGVSYLTSRRRLPDPPR
jgi:hypothetical protein